MNDCSARMHRGDDFGYIGTDSDFYNKNENHKDNDDNRNVNVKRSLERHVISGYR